MNFRVIYSLRKQAFGGISLVFHLGQTHKGITLVLTHQALPGQTNTCHGTHLPKYMPTHKISGQSTKAKGVSQLACLGQR